MSQSSSSLEKCRILRRQGFTLGEIIKLTNLPKTTIYGYIRDISLPLKIQAEIKKRHIRRLVDFSRARKGKCIKGREIVKPVGWSLDLIFIVSHFMFDGQIKYAGCEYYNRSFSLIKEMKRRVKNIFGIDSPIYKRDFGVSQLRYYNVELGSYISEKAKRLLNDIKNFSLSEKQVFLKSFFDDEGNAHVYKKIRSVRGFQKNLIILKLVGSLLEDFGIQSKVDEKYKEIVVSKKNNLIRFRSRVNFSKGIYVNPARKNSIWKQKLEKREILNKILNSYQV
ncbi:LAGLIDADG family homing endonuclease [Candidatus Wolfebacteria bacterium]|nr:LAGLIDADG family homing endonuclease [Candidatus Wolfebacteria bacterium]